MKKLFLLSMIIAGSFAVNSAYSQVSVNLVFERDFPGYTYYSYPAWNGHYRDRVYYEHYRPAFERGHSAYFHGRTFDRARYEREHHRGGHGRPVRHDAHRQRH